MWSRLKAQFCYHATSVVNVEIVQFRRQLEPQKTQLKKIRNGDCSRTQICLDILCEELSLVMWMKLMMSPSYYYDNQWEKLILSLLITIICFHMNFLFTNIVILYYFKRSRYASAYSFGFLFIIILMILLAPFLNLLVRVFKCQLVSVTCL